MLCDKRRGRQGEAVFVCCVINDAEGKAKPCLYVM